MQLPGRAFDLLLCFVQSPGSTLGKDQLLGTLWPGREVEEGSLAKTVCALRAGLAEHGSGLHLIQTLPGQGYRFTAAVEVDTAAAVQAPAAEPASGRAVPGPAGWWGLAWTGAALLVTATCLLVLQQPGREDTVSAAGKTLAVLPFESLAADPHLAQLTDSLHDAVLQHLAGVPGLVVSAPLSQDSHEALARRGTQRPPPPAATTFVRATVRVSAGKARLTVRVSDAGRGVVLWSETWTLAVEDLAGSGAEVATAVQAAVAAAGSIPVAMATSE